ncbi:MAG: hypothetical protein FWG10_06235 [Eubacteriaceae bacterium]|nr:hypothetical protein [Eubacteriaceae bacterium]
MRDEIKALQEERNQIFEDHYGNKIPKRVPMRLSVPDRVIAERLGLSSIDFNYDPSVLADAKFEIAQQIFTDTYPFTVAGSIVGRSPGFFQLLRSQSFVMSNTGYTQHPEVIGMDASQYPKLIADPVGFLFEDVIPRHFESFGLAPVGAVNYFMMGLSLLKGFADKGAPVVAQLYDEHGYWPGAPRGSSTSGTSPYDFIADQLRSFSEISKDIRRRRTELKEACDAVTPLMFVWGNPGKPHPLGCVRSPLHMPTYMREKDFIEIWMPSWQRCMEQWAARGARTRLFCEHDWTRLLDVIQDMPHGVEIQFEYGDPRVFKEKVGKKFLLTGMYPLSTVAHGSKQDVIDKAKEMLDVLMPGGGYSFDFDKGPLYLGDINFENLIALGETFRDYGVYSNPGGEFGKPINFEGFTIDPSIDVLPKSPYLHDWDSFKSEYPLAPGFAQGQLKQLQKDTFSTIMQLLR